MTNDQATHHWYALRVRSRAENSVSTILREKGYEPFLPEYQSTRRWSDRVKAVSLPLFPGYLFCRLNLSGRLLPILTTPGVLSFVGAGKTPLPVSDGEIAAIEAIVRSGLAALPWPSLAAGDKVLIERGPLAGLEGVAVKVDGKSRLLVSVPLLQRSVMVEIDRRWVGPVTERKGGRAGIPKQPAAASAQSFPAQSFSAYAGF